MARSGLGVAVAIICKTPSPGRSKTRLSPPLRPEECAEISACFIADLAATIAALADEVGATAYAVYTPVGSEAALRGLLPDGFRLMPQGEGDLGERLRRGIADLLDAGHSGAILVNSDSPTLPRAILAGAIRAVAAQDAVVLGPAIDGGYTLVGLSRPHDRLFAEMPWSTPEVLALTLERAAEIGLPTVILDPWYDIDDASSYAILAAEFEGIRPEFANPALPAQRAPRTQAFVASRMESVP